MSDAARRAVLIVGVLAVLVGIGVAGIGNGTGAPPPARPGAGPSTSASQVTPSGAESSAWFCDGATGPGGDAQATMILTNPSPRPVTGTVTTVSPDAAPVMMTVPVPGRTQTVVAPSGAGGGPTASTVVLNGSGVGVTQVVSGPLGFSNSPCASTTARQWYFADASTATGDTLTLSLFNPTDTVAVVDVSFVTASGLVAPPAYQGIDVPGDSLVAEDVGEHVQNTAHLATTVTSLSGEVVAAELEGAATSGRSGPSVVLGATRPSSSWSFAQNTDVTDGSTVFTIFNPSSRPARVTVRIGLQQGAAEPLVIRVPAGAVSTLETKRLTRIPANVPFAVTFVSAGGVGIVVDRQVAAPAGAPAPEVGDTPGAPGGSLRWLLPSEYSPSTGVSELAVVDLTTRPVTLRLSMLSPSGLVPVPGFGHQDVRPGVPLVVTPSSTTPVGTVPMELTSTGPVAVELDAVPVGSAGVVVSPALPVR
jgi:hypothetical protein